MLVILLALGFGNVGCYAQSTNDDTKLLGTWVDIDGSTTYVFTTDGIVTINDIGYRYGAVNGKLVIYYQGRDNNQQAYDYFISRDGKILILTGNLFGFSWGEVLRKPN